MRIFNIILILFISINALLILFISINAFSDRVDVYAIFEKADSLFKDNDIKGAISLYQGILDEGGESSELYYNMGICYFKIEEFEKSKSYFQKSFVLNPTSKIVKNRISQCNLKMGQKEKPKLFYIIWKHKLLSLFSKNIIVILSLMSILSVSYLLFLNMFGINKVQKRYIVLLCLTSLFFHFISSSKIKQENIFLGRENTESH